MPRKSAHSQLEKQQAAADKAEAAIRLALADAPKLTPQQANNIVGLLLVNTEPPKAGWVEETPGGEA